MDQHALEYVFPLEQALFEMITPIGGTCKVHMRLGPVLEVRLVDILEVIPLHPVPGLPPAVSHNASKAQTVEVANKTRALLELWVLKQKNLGYDLDAQASREGFSHQRTDKVSTALMYEDGRTGYNTYASERSYVPVTKLPEWLLDHCDSACVQDYNFDVLLMELDAMAHGHQRDYMRSIDSLKRRCERLLDEVVVEGPPVKKQRVE